MPQPRVAPRIIAFSAYQARHVISATCLTSRDRLDVARWQDAANLAGFDRLVVHDRDEGDASEVGNFLCAYRKGQAWSSWSFARRGTIVRAWCSLSWADRGEFASLAEALEAVLGAAGPADGRARADANHPGAVVTDIVPRLRGSGANRFGSAA